MTAPVVSPGLRPELARKIIWRLAPLLVLMYMFNQLDRANVGYASLTMNQDIGITLAQYGLGTSLFFLGYILFEIPSNLCLHRFGARVWMARIMITWGLISAASCLISNASWLYTARFALGVAEAGFFPGVVYFLTLWLPTRDRVWLMSLFIMAIPLTGMLGAPVSTWLMQEASLFGMSGWRSMLLLEALPATLMGVAVLFWLPDSPQRCGWLSAAERNEIEQALAADARRLHNPMETSASRVLRNPRVWALGLVYFGINATIISLLYFLPQVVKGFEATFNVKYSVFQVGQLTAIPFTAAIIAMALYGQYVRKRNFSVAFVAAPMIISAVALASALYLNTPVQTLIAFSVGATGCFCSISTFWQLPPRLLADRAAAAGIALITSIGVASGLFVGWFIGAVKDATGSFNLAMLVIAGFMTLSAILVLYLEGQRRAHLAPSNG
ncbi:MFS transporter [Pseudomonas sp. NPDC007930]|uniref:MFS transporter n=1 Tax=Pseudomonas sp. NPDC007930 TaxID=3364417 RepID=UPI0036E79F23